MPTTVTNSYVATPRWQVGGAPLFFRAVRVERVWGLFTWLIAPPTTARGQQPMVVPGVTTVEGGGVSRTVHVTRQDTGALIGTATSDPGTGQFEIQTDYAGPVNAVAFDRYGDYWAQATVTVLDQLVMPTEPNGHYYKATVAGTTGGAEPAWPTDGGSVVDGAVIWQDMGAMREPVIQGPFRPVGI